jgi:hypothetical protein
MTNTNQTDIDPFERLCQTKSFYELNREERELVLSMVTEAEYHAMHEFHQNLQEQIPEEITPTLLLKSKLDEALENKNRRRSLPQRRVPLLQSAAAAVLFFLMGLGASFLNERPAKIVHTTAEVIRYVDRPVKEIRYVSVPAKEEGKLASESEKSVQPSPGEKMHFQKTEATEAYPDIQDQQMMGMTDIAQYGLSMDKDTILRKMMLTMY